MTYERPSTEQIKSEVGKIDVDKLRQLPVDIEASCFSQPGLQAGIYLPEEDRLKPGNALMAMGHEGGGIFRIFLDWEDYRVDERSGLIARDSPNRGIDFIQVDYQNQEGVDIAADGEKVDDLVSRASVTYAKMSKFIAKCGELKPFQVRETASPEVKSKYPQAILDLDKSDDDIRRQLIEYLV